MPDAWWIGFGFVGQLIFGMRFVIQWIASERRKESYIPVYFWFLSLGGATILLTYAIHRRDPVFILGQTTGFIVYVRNLMLIYKKRSRQESAGEQ
ncbi:MAG TPA: lipid-A-disaccharide synthase N-terminal domain-containing protein [Acidobacteriota bacterium]|nr:lipid-A-disaccharide synthase N-terminal domain-containing protein [Acidobacteriota bacterium]